MMIRIMAKITIMSAIQMQNGFDTALLLREI
jgi:hypothetical protein